MKNDDDKACGFGKTVSRIESRAIGDCLTVFADPFL
jgi:hypothetical protein